MTMVQQQADPSQSALSELVAEEQPALPPSQQPISDQERASLHLDYEQTTELFRMLADIRFKLLAFVPTLTGIAISLLTGDKLEPWRTLLSLLVGVLVAGITVWQFKRRDDERYIWQFGIKGIERHVELDNLYQP